MLHGSALAHVGKAPRGDIRFAWCAFDSREAQEATGQQNQMYFASSPILLARVVNFSGPYAVPESLGVPALPVPANTERSRS